MSELSEPPDRPVTWHAAIACPGCAKVLACCQTIVTAQTAQEARTLARMQLKQPDQPQIPPEWIKVWRAFDPKSWFA